MSILFKWGYAIFLLTVFVSCLMLMPHNVYEKYKGHYRVKSIRINLLKSDNLEDCIFFESTDTITQGSDMAILIHFNLEYYHKEGDNAYSTANFGSRGSDEDINTFEILLGDHKTSIKIDSLFSKTPLLRSYRTKKDEPTPIRRKLEIKVCGQHFRKPEYKNIQLGRISTCSVAS